MTKAQLAALQTHLLEARAILRHVHRRGVHRKVGAACCRECRLLALWLQNGSARCACDGEHFCASEVRPLLAAAIEARAWVQPTPAGFAALARINPAIARAQGRPVDLGPAPQSDPRGDHHE